MSKGSKKRARKAAARSGKPASPTRTGRPTRTIGRFRNLGFFLALVAAVAAAIALIGVANLLSGDDDNTTTTPIDIPDHTAPAEGTTLGNADAPVTVYEYSDFQCPYCRVAADEIVPALDTAYLVTGKAKLIFKNLAFIGDESKWAAEAALCASDQGKFWDYHNKLFEEQKGENKGTFAVENLKRFAVEIGLNEGDFNTCLDEGRHTAELAEIASEADRRGIDATPAFFVGESKVDNNFEAISKAIDAALATPTPEVSPTAEGTPGG